MIWKLQPQSKKNNEKKSLVLGCISKTPVYLYMNSFSCSLIAESALCVHLCVCTFVRPCVRGCMRVCWLVVSRPAHPSQLVSLPLVLAPCPQRSDTFCHRVLLHLHHHHYNHHHHHHHLAAVMEFLFFFFFKLWASMSRLKLLLFPRLSPSVLK